jgi:hypothetical protein
MGGAKPWQIAVIALGVGALLWVLISQLTSSGTPDTAQDFVLVDVDTGELFKVHRPLNRSLSIPAVRPGTQKLNLFPVDKSEEGWKVQETFRGLLTKDMPAIQDLGSGLVKAVGDPEYLDLFGG